MYDKSSLTNLDVLVGVKALGSELETQGLWYMKEGLQD